jgi:hypothetical protein
MLDSGNNNGNHTEQILNNNPQDAGANASSTPSLDPATLDTPTKKPISEKKIAANRRNSEHSTGPHDTRASRFNALKHGLRAQWLTPLDDPEQFDQIVSDLTHEYPPRLSIHKDWIYNAALETVHISRANAIEANKIRFLCMPKASDPAKSDDSASDDSAKEISFALVEEYGAATMDRSQRYRTASLNRLGRYLRLLEPLRRKDSPEEIEPIRDSNGNFVI